MLRELGETIKIHREKNELTQEQLATRLSFPRTRIAHLEQGIRLPEPEFLRKICESLSIPNQYWEHFLEEDFYTVAHFERSLSELVGHSVSLAKLDKHCSTVARRAISELFHEDHTEDQKCDLFNSCLVYYDVQPLVTLDFFREYLSPDAFKSTDRFQQSVTRFQTDAIRLFNSFGAAYQAFNSGQSLSSFLQRLSKRKIENYRHRTDWEGIEQIPTSQLAKLGYIAVNKLRQERAERMELTSFLNELASKVREQGASALNKYGTKKRRKMDTLLRKFDSRLPHGFISSLFATDADELEREAFALAPKDDKDLAELAHVQEMGMRNLARYLAADHLDVYVATSMRLEADFVSVDNFVKNLFASSEIRDLKLRYFNPTQSWIEDRVAKGLVEALMLRRADVTIYMAQKEDSFGKDSEASVALGQGKPVIVYVPKLMVPELEIDSEKLMSLSKEQLVRFVSDEGSEEDKEPDDTIDEQGLASRLIEIRLNRGGADLLRETIERHWADFGLVAEAERIKSEDKRIEEERRKSFREWLDRVIAQKNMNNNIPADIQDEVTKMLVALTMRFEQRAAMFRKIHPLALQVVLSSGVLNGMIVVRSVADCAIMLNRLLRNDLMLQLEEDEYNYRLVETSSQSTIRVIAKHSLIASAFNTYYRHHPLTAKLHGQVEAEPSAGMLS